MTEEALRVALSSTAICEPIYIQGMDSKLTTQNGLLTQYERKELLQEEKLCFARYSRTIEFNRIKLIR